MVRMIGYLYVKQVFLLSVLNLPEELSPVEWGGRV